jgi:hypothetical protein
MALGRHFAIPRWGFVSLSQFLPHKERKRQAALFATPGGLMVILPLVKSSADSYLTVKIPLSCRTHFSYEISVVGFF